MGKIQQIIKKLQQEFEGFTLIELIIVIGVVAILAAITIVAINPSQNFIDSRNSSRQNEAREIQSAITQWIVDGGNLSSVTQEGNGQPLIGCAYGTNDVASGSGLDASVDLDTLLVDGSTSYLPEIPSDPRSATGVDTGYDICNDGTGRAIVTAPDAEDSATIAVPAPYSVSSSMNSTIGLTGNDVDLSWDDVSMPTYEVWRGTYAYFEPGDAYSTLLTSTASTSYTDTTAAVGDANTNHFYLIQGKDSNGNVTYVSSRTGEFDYALTPGNPGDYKYNAIGVPFTTSQFSNASELATAMGGSSDVDQVLDWREDTQTFDGYFPSFSAGNDFDLVVGDVTWVLLTDTADSNFTVYGTVPAQSDISYPLVQEDGDSADIMLPLQYISLSNASDLASVIGDVDNILMWDADTGFTTYDEDDLFGTDFSISVGQYYFVGGDANTPETWP